MGRNISLDYVVFISFRTSTCGYPFICENAHTHGNSRTMDDVHRPAAIGVHYQDFSDEKVKPIQNERESQENVSTTIRSTLRHVPVLIHSAV